jgi:hypothetical protein
LAGAPPAAIDCYLGGRLEPSVVDPADEKLRGFRLAKAPRLNIGEGAEISLA